MFRFLLVGICLSLISRLAFGDPCGMVLPVDFTGQNSFELHRDGLQKTYVFYRRGLETILIRPGFQGNIEEFGMLIPFPSPPAIRKVPEDVFAHIAAAVDPPAIPISLLQNQRGWGMGGFGGVQGFGGNIVPLPAEPELKVLREEAIGMYEVAVLEAGSAKALERWMTQHGYRYPQGMDHVCEEYIEDKWCFVAVKTRVGVKKRVDPAPGMRATDDSLPLGAEFNGHVQAMGFRFVTPELVVPMRLSAFNEGELRNIIYLLGEAPARIPFLPVDFVKRQIPGPILLRNLTRPLPVEVIGARPGMQGQERLFVQKLEEIKTQRDPEPSNGIAKDLFAADLMAWKKKVLSHPFEEQEKLLLAINERLLLRSSEIELLVHEAVDEQRDQEVSESLEEIRSMTLTVIDGDFPREILASRNLKFVPYAMNPKLNTFEAYSATQFGPGRRFGVYWRELTQAPRESNPELHAASEPERTPGSGNASGVTSQPWQKWLSLGGTILASVMLALVYRRRIQKSPPS